MTLIKGTIDTVVLDRKRKELEKSRVLLKEALQFLNKVPNNKYGDNYSICNKISKFLNG